MNTIEKMFFRHMGQAMARGIDWNLTLEQYKSIFSMICAESKKRMTLLPNQVNTLSIDRKNNALGYTIRNVRFICWHINRGKGNMSVKQWNKARM